MPRLSLPRSTTSAERRPATRAVARAVLLALAALAGASAQATHFRYTTYQWDRVNLVSSEGAGLNGAGVAVGSAVSSQVPLPQGAFVANSATLTPINLMGLATYGAAINDAGLWAGHTFDAGTARYRAVLRLDGATQIILGLPGDSFAAGINNSGMVVGRGETGGGQARAFVWDGNTTRLLPTFGGNSGRATGVNDAGQVVGWATNAGGLNRAFLWQNSELIDLGTLGGNASQARAINRQGVVVGDSNLVAFGGAQAFIRRGSTLESLGSLGGTSVARAINDFNLVVGSATDGAAVAQAFVAGSQGMHDLNHLLAIPPGSQGRLTVANAVNRQGQILAQTAAGFAVLLTPDGTLTWTGQGDPSFTDGASWDSGVGQGPSRFLDMVLAHPASQSVDLAVSAEVRSLVVGAAGGAGAGQMRLRLFNGATLTAEQGIVVERSGVLSGDGVIAGDLDLRGTLQVGCAAGCSGPFRTFQDRSHRFDVQNGGLVTGHGLLEAALTVHAGGQVRAGAGQVLRLQAPDRGSHTSAGVLEVRDGGQAEIGGLWTNLGGTVRLDDATVRFADGLNNQGQVHIGFGGANLFGRIDNRPGGRIIASGGNQTTFWDALVNNGEVRASAGSHLVYFGPVSGAGSFSTNGTGAYHRFEGGYAPGNSPADVVLGDTELASLLTMEIAGPVPGQQHDRITFTGSLRLDAGAALQVVLLDGFGPAAGQTFDLFDYAAPPQGVFETLSLPTLAPGLVWDASTLYQDGDLRVAAVPEPAAWWLMGGGLAWLMARRRSAARLERSL